MDPIASANQEKAERFWAENERFQKEAAADLENALTFSQKNPDRPVPFGVFGVLTKSIMTTVLSMNRWLLNLAGC